MTTTAHQGQKMSLWMAILANINVVVGGAFFINAPKISEIAGGLAPIAWMICALMLAPLAIIFARLAQRFPHAGSIYVYTKQAFGRFCGFAAGWMYFVGNTAGNLVLIDAFAQLTFGLLPATESFAIIRSYGPFYLSLASVALFTMLSTRGVAVFKKIQLLVFGIYLVPLIVLFASAALLSDAAHLTSLAVAPTWFASCLPMMIFAYIGIELGPTMIHVIQDGAKNITKVIYGTLLLVTLSYVVCQLILILCLGPGCGQTGAFACLGWTIGSRFAPWAATLFYYLISSCMGLSFLTGAYAVFCANNWLLHAMADDLHGFSRKFLLQVNRHQEPRNCILVQGLIMVALLCFAHNALWIMHAATIGVVLAYVITVFSFIRIFGFKATFAVATLAVCTTFAMAAISLRECMADGFVKLLPLFVVLFSFVLIYALDFFDKQVSDA